MRCTLIWNLTNFPLIHCVSLRIRLLELEFEGTSYLLQCSGLENSMNWIACGVTNSQTRLSDFHFTLSGSVQFSHSVVSNSLRPNGLQHARPPCPSPTPGVHSNSCPSSWWCHLTISSSVFPFFSHLQSFPVSGSFQMSQLYASGGPTIGVSVST